MLILPIETPNHAADALVIVLGDDSLERMAEADPAEVILRQSGRTLVNPTVLVCHKKESPEFTRLLQSRDLPKILDHLRRGFRFRPEKGDHDHGPRRLGADN